MTLGYAIEHYWLDFQAGGGTGRAKIVLYDAQNEWKAAAYFLPDGEELPDARVQDGHIYMYFPMHVFHPVMDMLRNEKPIRAYFVNPKLAGVRTGQEPVGEEESSPEDP